MCRSIGVDLVVLVLHHGQWLYHGNLYERATTVFSSEQDGMRKQWPAALIADIVTATVADNHISMVRAVGCPMTAAARDRAVISCSCCPLVTWLRYRVAGTFPKAVAGKRSNARRS